MLALRAAAFLNECYLPDAHKVAQRRHGNGKHICRLLYRHEPKGLVVICCNSGHRSSSSHVSAKRQFDGMPSNIGRICGRL